jgi:hypothetical protein
MTDQQFECLRTLLTCIANDLSAIRGRLEKQASLDAVFVGERGPETMVIPGEADRHQSDGFTVFVDTSKAMTLLQQMNSLIAKGEELGISDEYLKDQERLLKEIVHLLPDTIQFFAQPGNAVSGKSDCLTA